jgi:hypothetical protein
MDDEQIDAVARVLDSWNPLGDNAARIGNLDGYHGEAIDILFHIDENRRIAKVISVVRQVLNEAFYLDLSRAECEQPAREIVAILAAKS